MDNSRLSREAQKVLKRLKDRLCISPTNKKSINFIIIDYEHLLNENKNLRNEIKKNKLLACID